MISIETTSEPGRNLMSSDAMLVDAETGNVFGFPQVLSLPTGTRTAPLAKIQGELIEPHRYATFDRLADLQRDVAMARVKKYPQSAHVANAAGQTLLALDRVKEAIDLFRQALDRDPAHRMAKLNLARSYTLLKQFREAEEVYRELIESTQDWQALKNLAQLLTGMKHFEEAEQLLSEALGLRNDDAGAYNERAVARLAQHRVREAMQDLRIALRLDVRFAAAHNNLGVCYLFLGSPVRALRAFRAAITVEPTHTDAVLNYSTVAEQLGFTEQAVRVLEEYLHFRPQDLRALDTLARLDIVSGQPRRSLARLKQLLREVELRGKVEQRTRILNNMGAAYLLLGEPDIAAQYFQQAIQGDPANCIPHRNYASILLQRGRFEDVRTVLTVALEHCPQDPGTLMMLAYYHLGQDEPQAAIGYVRRALELNSSDWQPYAWLGSVLADEFEQYDEAVHILRQGLSAVPQSTMLKNNLAYVLLMKGAKTEARQILDAVGPADAYEEVFLTATRGLLAIREGRLDEGRRLYNLAARLTKDPGTRVLALQKKAVELARTYAENGDVARAHTLLREALQIETPHKMFRHQAERLQRPLAEAPAHS